jgi:hypothetical protein
MMSVVSRAKASGMQRCSLVGGVELRKMHGIERARRAYLSFPILLPIPLGVASAYAECVIGRDSDKETSSIEQAPSSRCCFNARTRLPRRPTQRVGYAPGHTCLFAAHGWHGAPNHMEPSSAAPFPGVAGGCTRWYWDKQFM